MATFAVPVPAVELEPSPLDPEQVVEGSPEVSAACWTLRKVCQLTHQA
jgi:hypothetical protein